MFGIEEGAIHIGGHKFYWRKIHTHILGRQIGQKDRDLVKDQNN